jgi:hypothetical protein
MNTQTILQIALVLHLIALAVAIGITLANAIANRQFWKLYDRNRPLGLAAFRATTKFRIFGMIGLAVLIVTGVIMLWIYQWTFVELLWFKIKMVVVVLLFVNGFTLGRTTAQKLERILNVEDKSGDPHPETTRLRRNLETFQFIQLALFVVIIVLAVFRFT